MVSDTKKLYEFLRAAQGDWRNAIAVECRHCEPGSLTGGRFLISTDRDGAPIVFPVALFQSMTGQAVDSDECISKITCEGFEALFHSWLVWHTQATRKCVFLQIAEENQKSRNKQVWR